MTNEQKYGKLLANVTLDGKELAVRLTKYADGNLAVVLYDGTELYTVLSVNLTESSTFAPGEFAVKNWSENEDVAPPMLNTGLFEDTGRRIPTGFVEAPVWRLRTGSSSNAVN